MRRLRIKSVVGPSLEFVYCLTMIPKPHWVNQPTGVGLETHWLYQPRSSTQYEPSQVPKCRQPGAPINKIPNVLLAVSRDLVQVSAQC